jgi:hypothetical protein
MFQFTIRELLLLTLIVAMGVAWWVDRGRLFELYTEHKRDAEYLAEVLGDSRLSDNRSEIAHRLLVKYGWASP